MSLKLSVYMNDYFLQCPEGEKKDEGICHHFAKHIQ